VSDMWFLAFNILFKKQKQKTQKTKEKIRGVSESSISKF